MFNTEKETAADHVAAPVSVGRAATSSGYRPIQFDDDVDDVERNHAGQSANAAENGSVEQLASMGEICLHSRGHATSSILQQAAVKNYSPAKHHAGTPVFFRWRRRLQLLFGVILICIVAFYVLARVLLVSSRTGGGADDDALPLICWEKFKKAS